MAVVMRGIGKRGVLNRWGCLVRVAEKKTHHIMKIERTIVKKSR
jgi:hypothetical protein